MNASTLIWTVTLLAALVAAYVYVTRGIWAMWGILILYIVALMGFYLLLLAIRILERIHGWAVRNG